MSIQSISISPVFHEVERLALLWMVILLASIGCNRDVFHPGSMRHKGEGETSTDAQQKSRALPQALVVPVALVSQQEHEETIEVPMSIDGYEMALLKSRIDGYVAVVHKNIGDEVAQGDVLIELSVPELVAEENRRQKMVEKAMADAEIAITNWDSAKAELIQAKSQLEEQVALKRLRQSEFNRMRELVNRGALRQEKLDEAQYALESTQAAMKRIEADVNVAEFRVRGAEAYSRGAQRDVEVAQAEKEKSSVMAGYLKIQAPFAGLITQRMVDPGAFVRPASNGGSPMLSIERVDRVRAILFVPMNVAGKLDVGDRAVLHSIQSLSDQTIDGSITRLARSFHRGSRMMRAEIDLPNPDRKLKPGDYGKVTITLQAHGQLPTVPKTAVGRDPRGSYVLVLDQHDVCRKRRVSVRVAMNGKVGFENDENLLMGLRVIANGVDRFRDNQKLESDSISGPFGGDE